MVTTQTQHPPLTQLCCELAPCPHCSLTLFDCCKKSVKCAVYISFRHLQIKMKSISALILDRWCTEAHTHIKTSSHMPTIKALQDSERAVSATATSRWNWSAGHKLVPTGWIWQMPVECFKNISKIRKPYMTNLVKAVTNLGAPGRYGVHLTSSVALEDLKSRDRMLRVQTAGQHSDSLD